MRKLKNYFDEHPKSIGETYLGHLWCCLRTSASMIYIVIILLIHGIFPFLFERSASSLISKLHENIQRRVNCEKEASKRTDSN